MPNYYYVLPHRKISRDVTDADIERVKEYAEVMRAMCHRKYGVNPGAFAIAHPQVDDQDPLRFFVTHENLIVCNPKIIRKTQVPVKRTEGCMTFPFSRPVDVMRSHKCEVEFQVLEDGKLGEVQRQNLSGRDAQVFQHETEHLDGKYVYEDKELWEKTCELILAQREESTKAGGQTVPSLKPNDTGEDAPQEKPTAEAVSTGYSAPDLSVGDGEVRGKMPASEVRDSVAGGV